MKLELFGKFYDNHSLSIINRNLYKALSKIEGVEVRIISLDSYDPSYKLDKDSIRALKAAESNSFIPDVQIRHTYPPVWAWPEHEQTKVVYIQPWEYSRIPFEWEYKFETFADGLVVLSNHSKATIIRAGIKPSKVDIVPPGYNSELFNTQAGDKSKFDFVDPDYFNFVYVGNSQWRKGLDILLRAWSRVFVKADKARLIIKDNPAIYGDNSILNEIIKLQVNSGCGKIFYIDEQLSEKEMANLYKASKILVHPYRAEGFGMHIQEAVACGCAPIVSKNGPSDDFIFSDSYNKIETQSKIINIEDPNLFIGKAGDSYTNMGSHSFIQEPIQEHLEYLLHTAYYTHDKSVFHANDDKHRLTDWNQSAAMLVSAVEKYASKTTAQRGIL